jgi:hypothetical protein
MEARVSPVVAERRERRPVIVEIRRCFPSTTAMDRIALSAGAGKWRRSTYGGAAEKRRSERSAAVEIRTGSVKGSNEGTMVTERTFAGLISAGVISVGKVGSTSHSQQTHLTSGLGGRGGCTWLREPRIVFLYDLDFFEF